MVHVGSLDDLDRTYGALGTAVNAVLVGNTDPKKALDAAQAEAAKLF